MEDNLLEKPDWVKKNCINVVGTYQIENLMQTKAFKRETYLKEREATLQQFQIQMSAPKVLDDEMEFSSNDPQDTHEIKIEPQPIFQEVKKLFIKKQ